MRRQSCLNQSQSPPMKSLPLVVLLLRSRHPKHNDCRFDKEEEHAQPNCSIDSVVLRQVREDTRSCLGMRDDLQSDKRAEMSNGGKHRKMLCYVLLSLHHDKSLYVRLGKE